MAPEGDLSHAEAALAGFSVDVGPDVLEGATLIAVSGDLDLSTSAALETRLETRLEGFEAARSTIVLDLSDVTFMDSTGLRALWTIRQRVASTGGQTLLRAPSDAVRRVLKTTKLDKVFDYADGVASD